VAQSVLLDGIGSIDALLGRRESLEAQIGLVPSENSSGERRRQGQIAKSGSRHARRFPVEAAWHYRRAPRKGWELRRRQEGQPQAVCTISWKAQQRLHRSWVRLAPSAP
jgi:transposase